MPRARAAQWRGAPSVTRRRRWFETHGRLLEDGEPARPRPRLAHGGLDVGPKPVGRARGRGLAPGRRRRGVRVGRRRSCRALPRRTRRRVGSGSAMRLTERAEAAMDAGLHGPDGDVEDRGHLIDRQVEVEAQDDDRAVVEGQVVQSTARPGRDSRRPRRRRRHAPAPGRERHAARPGSGAVSFLATR